MDIASVIGLVLALGLIVGSILLGGGSFAAFFDAPSMMVVVGGAFAAVLICFPLKNFLSMFGVVKNIFFNRMSNIPELIETIVSLAETARRDGLLALENRVSEIDNQFVVLGIQMAVDGTRPEVIEDIMRTELDSIATRHRDGKAIFDQLGRFAPAFGMIGTLVGLVIMLQNMDDPSKIGPGMAVALLTTMYGAIIANAFALPLADRLARRSAEETLLKTIVIKGVMAIQSGDNPRIVEQKLKTFLPPSERPSEEEQAA